jgi:hypothetical protein
MRTISGNLHYFKGSAVFTVVCLILAWALGRAEGLSAMAALGPVFIAAVLAVLEVSLSFDNAVVNAKVLAGMSPFWRHCFITWGIAIAVFGMRVIFPLGIVAAMAEINPWDALVMAATAPDEYARIMHGAHVSIAGFGGAFLGMVGLKFFFDVHKEVHWVRLVEEPLTRLGKIEAVEIGFILLALVAVSRLLPLHQGMAFLLSGLGGIIAFVGVEGIGAMMGVGSAATAGTARAGFSSFLYLEVLDASFSFDGVIGAFALTHNLFLIALGLGIGAMFVRSLTLMLVDKGTLTEYRYLEHGAFWAILALAGLMLGGAVVPVSELLTGLIGAALIGLSFVSSVRLRTNKKNRS